MRNLIKANDQKRLGMKVHSQFFQRESTANFKTVSVEQADTFSGTTDVRPNAIMLHRLGNKHKDLVLKESVARNTHGYHNTGRMRKDLAPLLRAAEKERMGIAMWMQVVGTKFVSQCGLMPFDFFPKK